MSRYLVFLLLAQVFLQGCRKSPDSERDFIDRGEYSRKVGVVSSSRSESGENELHFRLVPYDPADGESVFIRLGIAPADQFNGSAMRDSATFLILQDGGPEYRLDHRELFDAVAEMHGKLFPIETFAQPKG